MKTDAHMSMTMEACSSENTFLWDCDFCSGCPDGGTPLRQSGGLPRVCTAGVRTCPSTHTCSEVTLQPGVAGRTLGTLRFCCPKKSTTCSLNQDAGQICVPGGLTRYFFNPTTRSCQTFNYNGCGGNANNFPSLRSCSNFCNSAG